MNKLIGKTWDIDTYKDFRLIYLINNKHRFVAMFTPPESNRKYIHYDSRAPHTGLWYGIK